MATPNPRYSTRSATRAAVAAAAAAAAASPTTASTTALASQNVPPAPAPPAPPANLAPPINPAPQGLPVPPTAPVPPAPIMTVVPPPSSISSSSSSLSSSSSPKSIDLSPDEAENEDEEPSPDIDRLSSSDESEISSTYHSRMGSETGRSRLDPRWAWEWFRSPPPGSEPSLSSSSQGSNGPGNQPRSPNPAPSASSSRKSSRTHLSDSPVSRSSSGQDPSPHYHHFPIRYPPHKRRLYRVDEIADEMLVDTLGCYIAQAMYSFMIAVAIEAGFMAIDNQQPWDDNGFANPLSALIFLIIPAFFNFRVIWRTLFFMGIYDLWWEWYIYIRYATPAWKNFERAQRLRRIRFYRCGRHVLCLIVPLYGSRSPRWTALFSIVMHVAGRGLNVYGVWRFRNWRQETIPVRRFHMWLAVFLTMVAVRELRFLVRPAPGGFGWMELNLWDFGYLGLVVEWIWSLIYVLLWVLLVVLRWMLSI